MTKDLGRQALRVAARCFECSQDDLLRRRLLTCAVGGLCGIAQQLASDWRARLRGVGHRLKYGPSRSELRTRQQFTSEFARHPRRVTNQLRELTLRIEGSFEVRRVEQSVAEPAQQVFLVP